MYKNFEEIEKVYKNKTRNFHTIALQFRIMKDYEKAINIFNEHKIKHDEYGLLYISLPDGINILYLKLLYSANIWFKLV